MSQSHTSVVERKIPYTKKKHPGKGGTLESISQRGKYLHLNPVS